jgi:hypothetical protein
MPRFGKDKDYGSIEKGKIADLLLLEKDPTTDINALADIHTVIHRGKTFYPHQLLAVTPEILVQQQLNAFNAHDIEAFLQPYSDSVALYDQSSGKLLMKGKDQVRLRYTDMFTKLTELHCELKSRMVVGNTVIDHEKLAGMKSTPVEAAAVYTIDKGKIVKVYFVR